MLCVGFSLNSRNPAQFFRRSASISTKSFALVSSANLFTPWVGFSLRWLVPVFHARVHVRLPTREDLLARKAKQIWRRSALFAKGWFALFENKVSLTETVSPRQFLIISIYGRKMLSELNTPVLETSSHLCCDRSCRDRGPRDSSTFKKSLSNFQKYWTSKIPFQFTSFYFLDVFYFSAIVYLGQGDEEKENYKSRWYTGGCFDCFHLQKTGEQTKKFCESKRG